MKLKYFKLRLLRQKWRFNSRTGKTTIMKNGREFLIWFLRCLLAAHFSILLLKTCTATQKASTITGLNSITSFPSSISSLRWEWSTCMKKSTQSTRISTDKSIFQKLISIDSKKNPKRMVKSKLLLSRGFSPLWTQMNTLRNLTVTATFTTDSPRLCLKLTQIKSMRMFNYQLAKVKTVHSFLSFPRKTKTNPKTSSSINLRWLSINISHQLEWEVYQSLSSLMFSRLLKRFETN